jgi:hypothetical protein
MMPLTSPALMATNSSLVPVPNGSSAKGPRCCALQRQDLDQPGGGVQGIIEPLPTVQEHDVAIEVPAMGASISSCFGGSGPGPPST